MPTMVDRWRQRRANRRHARAVARELAARTFLIRAAIADEELPVLLTQTQGTILLIGGCAIGFVMGLAAWVGK